jgi:hypothetical protein
MSNSTAPSMTTPHEFRRLLEELPNDVTDAYNHDMTATTLIRHFHFVHRNINYLTQEVMRHQTERQEVYGYMMENMRFCTTLRPLLNHLRQRMQQQRYHPYVRSPSPSPPSPDSNEPSVLSVEIHEIETTTIESPPRTQSTSHQTSPSTSPKVEDSTVAQLFTQNELICERCMHHGHEAYDCDQGQPLTRVDTPHPNIAILERHDFQEGPSNRTDSPTELFHTAIDEIPGSRYNPIII